MEESDDAGETKLSRRRFIKMAGGSLAAGTAAVALGSAAGALLKPNLEKASASREPEARAARVGAAPLPLMESTVSDTVYVAPEHSFSIFWITDTQFLSESNPAMFRMMNGWIVENWARFNGKMVIHTGDVVQTGPPRRVVQRRRSHVDTAREQDTLHLVRGKPRRLRQRRRDFGVEGERVDPALNPSAVSARVNSAAIRALGGRLPRGDEHRGQLLRQRLGLSRDKHGVERPARRLAVGGGILDNPAYANHHVIMAPHAYIDANGSLDNPRWITQLSDFISAFTALLDAHSSNMFLTLNGHFATESGYNTPHP